MNPGLALEQSYLGTYYLQYWPSKKLADNWTIRKKNGQSELLFMKSFPISVIGVCSLSLLYASGIQGAKGLGIDPIISAGEISEETSEHLGIMAYAARFLNLSPSDITYQHSYNETRVSLITVSNINGDFAETVTLMNHL